jgi:hypothetical protein
MGATPWAPSIAAEKYTQRRGVAMALFQKQMLSTIRENNKGASRPQDANQIVAVWRERNISIEFIFGGRDSRIRRIQTNMAYRDSRHIWMASMIRKSIEAPEVMRL